jgi:4-hydroxy-2-oxovalerate aldolase
MTGTDQRDEADIQVFDCTLRDGGYTIDFQFTAEETSRIAEQLEAAGITYVEVGHGLGVGANRSPDCRASGETDADYIEAAADAVTDADIGVFYLPSVGTIADLEDAAEAGADFIRVGANVTEWETLEPGIRAVRDLGMTSFGNLLRTYAVPPETTGRRARDLEEWGADVVYVVDSAGCMTPDDVEAHVSAVARHVEDATVGFHGHDNLSLAVANSLTALEAGATIVDTTLRGMGRSAGNACTEVFATVLEKQGRPAGLDKEMLMDLGDTEIAHLTDDKRFTPLHVTAGFSCFHSSYMDVLTDIAADYELDPRTLMTVVSRRSVTDVTPQLMRDVAADLVGEDEPS